MGSAPLRDYEDLILDGKTAIEIKQALELPLRRNPGANLSPI
jgi:hypothetical protein